MALLAGLTELGPDGRCPEHFETADYLEVSVEVLD